MPAYVLGTGSTLNSPYVFVRDGLECPDFVELRFTNRLDDGQWHQIMRTFARNGSLDLCVDGIILGLGGLEPVAGLI